MLDRYDVTLTLIRDMLATNPCDPNVMDAHILDRQRKIIMEKSKLNTTVNKYLEQIQISKERGDEEVALIFDKLEALTGYVLNAEEREAVLAGNISLMKETFAEMDVKGTTVFFWDKEKDLPMIGDHMILGFLKASAEAICRTLPRKNGTVMGSTSFTQSIVNQHVRIGEQFITFDHDIKRGTNGEPAFLQRSLRAMTAQGPRVSLAKSEAVPAGAKLSFELKVLKNSPMTEEHLRTLFSYGELCGLGQWRNAGWGQFTYTLAQR